MSTITDANDRATLEAIGRNPGVKRSHWSVTKASVARLIQAGLVAPPNSSGKLYLTDAGKAALAPTPSGLALRPNPPERCDLHGGRSLAACDHPAYEPGGQP
jgi:hypothetical protein